jgi:toxin ParE1/3/4
MTTQIIHTPSAIRDLNAITDWIAEHDLGAALNFYDDVDRILTLISRYPLLGQAVDHLQPGLRRHTLGDYLLFYRPRGDAIELIRVLHGTRDIDRLFD